ncbi:MAG: YggS family pyridoxal phosphate-dependent enzyme [Planctomycetes bacterium]|nr:YggS family pyridoxal phosphate-dependent enzyme [Planctomycetota bacterium]
MKRKLLDNLKRVQQRIADACARAGRDPRNVTLVAVTKSATPDVVRLMVEMGVQDLGESRVGELVRRAGMLQEWLGRRVIDPSAVSLPRPRWHMIGHVQRNKVKDLLPWADLIHSVDSLRLAEEIDARAAKLDRVMPVLLEVNAGGEPQKSGVAVAATTHLAEQITSLKHLEVRGLMAMAPLVDDATIIRRAFERVRELFDEIVGGRLCGPAFRELSLGMSNDFEYGIEFGATFVRIGTALFEGIPLASQPMEVT